MGRLRLELKVDILLSTGWGLLDVLSTGSYGLNLWMPYQEDVEINRLIRVIIFDANTVTVSVRDSSSGEWEA